MSRTLGKMAILLACLGLFACGPDGGGGGGTGGAGGTGGTGGAPPGECGNGLQEGDEECDDGNLDNTDYCLDTCKNAHCGDGFERTIGLDAEDCDAGSANSDTDPNACRTTCVFAGCGDGVVDDGEQCDNGDANSDTEPGACRATGAYACRNATCGDGVTDPDEQCDDGNFENEDGCRNDCTATACGDGVIDFNEDCDDGEMNGQGSCTMDCRSNRCGDGYVWEGFEACDPQAEPWATNKNCTPECKLNVCGDGHLHEFPAVEACEPNPSNPDDTCSEFCQYLSCGDGIIDVYVTDDGKVVGEACDDGANNDGSAACYNCRWSVCGDGAVRVGVEQCDPGVVGGPDCNADCTLPRCGDGHTDKNEQCDDGNQNQADGCLNNCTTNTCGDGHIWTGKEQCDAGAANGDGPNTCRTDCRLPTCGDGIIDNAAPYNEVCDDGNTSSSDLCLGTCKGFNTCGDGFLHEGVEACDDGNTSNTDGCVAGCVVAFCGDGFVQAGVEQCDPTAPGAPANCRANCTLPRCGDSIVDAGEVCDDGNVIDTDGCRADCRAFNVCGDGVLNIGVETCDDGNTRSNDACLGTCKPAMPTVVFSGFSTLEATMRAPVSMQGQINAGFDPAARMRWRITVLNGTAPVAGVRAFFKSNNTSTNHLDWTDMIETDATGIAWYGVPGGFTAAEFGLDGTNGTTMPISVLFPAAGTFTFRAELVNTSAGNLLVGSGSTPATVGAKKLGVVFTGFDTVREHVRSAASIRGTLPTTVVGTRVVGWRLTVTEGGIPTQGFRAYVKGASASNAHGDWTEFVETNGTGTMWLPPAAGFPASTLHGAGGTTQLSLEVPAAGTFTVLAELIEISTGTQIGHQSTTATVGFDRLVTTFTGFTGMADNIRKAASIHVALDPRYAPLPHPTGKFRFTVTNGTGTGVANAKFFYRVAGDGANHLGWQTAATTAANGQAIWNDGVTLASLQGAGQTYDFSVAIPGTGVRNIRVDLLDSATANGTLIDGDATSTTLAQSVGSAFAGPPTITAGVRTAISQYAWLHASFDPATPLLWKYTVTRAATAVANVQFYYSVPGDGGHPSLWTGLVTTAADGTTTWPASGPFLPSATYLQLAGGETYPFGIVFPAAGTYAVKAELVLASSPTTVVGGETSTLTVVAAP